MPAKPRVFLTRALLPSIEHRLDELFEVEFNSRDMIYDEDGLIERIRTFQPAGLLVCLSDRISAKVIEALPASVRIISTYSVGYNHIDLDAAKRRCLTVTYTPDAVTTATADCALLLLLAACRQAHAFEERLRHGQWQGWTPAGLLGHDPAGKILGIVGLGRIGRAVAKRARAFGMEIHYHNRKPLAPDHEDGAIYHPTLESLFRVSRFVSLHAPSTPETLGMINAESLSWLPKGAVLVNTARGDQVVDDDLIAALQSGRLVAAGLDVFAGEPDLDKRYLSLPNVALLPHIGTSTVETRERMGWDAISNLTEFFAGREPPWKVV